MNDRRTFLKQAGLLAASLPLLQTSDLALAATAPAGADKWQALRRQFDLDPNYLHFANFLLTSHPRPVQQAIDALRARFNANPGEAVDWDREEVWKYEDETRAWAGRYFGVKPAQVALTGSTTDGLAAIYVMGKASLRSVTYRDVVTATIVYDNHPIFDHFRNVDDDTVLGVIDRKGDEFPLFF